MRLLNLFKRKPKTVKELFPQAESPIVEAWRHPVTDVVYYQYEDIQRSTCQRALQAWTFINELNMRVDRDYLIAHVEAYDKMFSSKTLTVGDIVKLKQYNDWLKDRLNWILDMDIVYKLASVVYFDSTENPKEYDFQYNNRKINEWKKSIPVNDFFSSAPILQLVPWLKDTQFNIQEYSTATAAIKAQQYSSLISN